MKFTSEYFMFPIKVYDGVSLRELMKNKEEFGEETREEADWIAGKVRIPLKEFLKHRVWWHEGYSKSMTVADVAKEGFDVTVVYVERMGEFTCTWTMKEFEDRLNRAIERYESTDEKTNDKPDELTW